MKYLFLACLPDKAGSFGGAERSIINLANWIADNTTDEVFLESVEGTGGAYQVSPNVVFHGNSMIYSSSIKIHYNMAKNVARVINTIKPDIVIGFWIHPLFYAIPYLLGKNIKMVYSARNDPSRNYSIISRIMRWFVVRYAAGIVFQTNQAKDFFSKSIKEKSIVIPNPTSIKKGEYKLPDVRDNKIVTVGRLELQKNQKMLINAFVKVREVYPDMRLEIYGEGSQRYELENLIRELNLNSSVFLMGACKDVFSKIRSAKLFVLSSDFEGMPNALIEAMSLGIPSISTDCPCGGPRMLIQDGINGYLVPVGNERVLADKILNFLNTDDVGKKKISLQGMMLLDELEYGKIMRIWYKYIHQL